MRPAAAALAALAIAGCGGMSAPGTDGGPADGGFPYCDMTLSFSPVQPQAPGVVIATGQIQKVGLFGIETYDWAVTRDAVPVPFSLRNLDGSEIEFAAEQPGPYRVSLSGSVDGIGCTDATETVNAVDPTAATRTYRLRFLPARSHPAPTQDRIVQIPGGADYVLGTVGLDNGITLSGSVTDSSGQPLAGYMRVALTGAAGTFPAETFADASGQFEARVMPGTYDVLVVPDGTGAPAPIALLGQSATALSALEIPDGELITGTVVDGSGTPIAGATVSARVGGVPSTLAVTDPAGAFVMQARVGAAASITVTPPAGSGLPRLEIDEGAGLLLSSSEPLAIAYSPALTTRTLSVPLTASDGSTPAPGARLTLIARTIAGAGTVTPSGGAPRSAAGKLRVSEISDAAGQVAMLVPEAIYDAVIVPPAGGAGRVALTSIDLSSGVASPPSLALGTAATVTGVVEAAGGGRISGVRVTAIPTGLLADISGAGDSKVSGDTGEFALELIGGGSYDLVLDSADLSWARSRAALVAPPAGGSLVASGLIMRRAIRVSGTVSIPGVAGGAAGVHVMVLCHECSGAEAIAPIAEAVTGAIGSFALAVPDPAEAP